MNAVDKTVQDVNNLYNITTSLYTSLSYNQLVLHIRSVWANLWDSLSYIRTVSMYTMDYISTATTGTLSPHVLPNEDLKRMLSHIEETLPPTMHLPVSSVDTIHFYRYLCTHILIANRQFLLLIDITIQDHIQQLSVYKIFTLDIPHGNFTTWYEVNNQYLGVTQDEAMAVEISQHQFSICQIANGQFCNINAPLQLLPIPSSCITALYAKNAASITTRYSLQIRKAQSISIPLSIPSKCVDTDFSTFYSDNQNNPHLPRGNNKIYHSTQTHLHLAPTTSLQHYITTLSFTTMIWTSSISC